MLVLDLSDGRHLHRMPFLYFCRLDYNAITNNEMMDENNLNSGQRDTTKDVLAV